MSNLFIISAPSGAGKTTVALALIKRLRAKQISIDRVITYTTKKPRLGEKQGIDYYFVSEDDFRQKIKEDFFIEWSGAYNAYYGSPRSILVEIKQNIRSYVLVIDRAGLQKIQKQKIQNISFWIEPPSFKTLSQRLYDRGTETGEQLAYRLNLARDEMKAEEKFPLCTYKIINDQIGNAVREIEEKVLNKVAF